MVKVGGSLAQNPVKLRALCAKLSELASAKKILVVPGGGEFADTVRCMDSRYKLSQETSHRMAILGMDQYGLVLADLTPNAVAVNTLMQAKHAMALGKLTVLLPSNLMLKEKQLERSWDVTSDSIAVFVASRLHARQVVLAKDVDGIYMSDPKKNKNAFLIEKISAADLLATKAETCVDRFLPKLLLTVHRDCFVVNGLFPERVELALKGQETVGTTITSS